MFSVSKNIFECENSQFNGKPCVSEFSYVNHGLRVDFVDIGEGLCGDYNPADPEDEPLLRFDVYKKEDGEWVAVNDGSYCTRNSVFTPVKDLKSMARTIYTEMKDALDGGYSGKKTAEGLSWITP